MKLVFESVTLGKGIGISSLFSSLLLHVENKEIYQLSILTYVLIVARSVLLYVRWFTRCFFSRPRTCRTQLYGDVTTGGEGMINLALYSQFTALESLSCHTCCDKTPRFLRSHPKNTPYSFIFKDK